jgi:hypothetical protein
MNGVEWFPRALAIECLAMKVAEAERVDVLKGTVFVEVLGVGLMHNPFVPPAFHLVPGLVLNMRYDPSLNRSAARLNGRAASLHDSVQARVFSLEAVNYGKGLQRRLDKTRMHEATDFSISRENTRKKTQERRNAEEVSGKSKRKMAWRLRIKGWARGKLVLSLTAYSRVPLLSHFDWLVH